MDRSLSQILNTLVPSLSGPIPAELLELAISLLAQSRSKVGSLRAEEEIARPYACANLACERLKQQLGLPKIESHPPCPPKVYQKLYRYLDTELPVGTRRSGRSSQGNRKHTINKPTEPQAKTPSRSVPHRFLNPKPASNLRASSEPPDWTMPLIRKICKKLEAPAAPPHIYAGVSSILSSVSAGGEEIELNVSALIVALYFLVFARLSGVATEDEEYQRQKEESLEVVRTARSSNPSILECEDEDITNHMRWTGAFKWTAMDWFSNIGIGAGVDNVARSNAVAQVETEEDDDPMGLAGNQHGHLEEYTEEYLQPGLNTMLDDRVDFFSEARRRSFERWKEKTLRRIEELESQMQNEASVR